MNKLFGLFLLALACWMPSSAYAVQCFWVGGTAPWDNTNTGGGGTGGIKWASASGGGTACGGAGPGGSPAAADDATFDASSGGGTVTVNATIALTNWTFSGFTGTIDFATNNNNLTASGNVTVTSGTNTLNMGSGTFSLSAQGAFWNVNNATTTVNAGTSTIALTATTGGAFRRFAGASKTYNIITVAGNPNNPTIFTSAWTALTTLTINAPNEIVWTQGTTFPITTLTTITATNSTMVSFTTTDFTGSRYSISSANNFTCTWCAFTQMNYSGGGTLTSNPGINLGNNGFSVTPPTAGGGGGRIIGG